MNDTDEDRPLPGERAELEDRFVQLPYPHSLQLLTNAVGAILKRWGGELEIPAAEMGEVLSGCSVWTFINPRTQAVKLYLDDPRDPRITPGTKPGHA